MREFASVAILAVSFLEGVADLALESLWDVSNLVHKPASVAAIAASSLIGVAHAIGLSLAGSSSASEGIKTFSVRKPTG